MVATNNSGTISFDGLASGLKTNEIVDAMVNAQKAPIRQLDRREETLKAHKSAYDQVLTLTHALDAAARNLASAANFVSHKARSSDEDVLKVSTGQGAKPGLYTIDVKQLATVQRSVSATQESDEADSTLSAGTVGWTINGEHFSIEISDKESLSNVADAINDVGGKLSATLLFDGDHYRLQLTGTEVGRHHKVTFDPDQTGLRLDDESFLVQEAQDATLVLDRVTTIRRGDNVVNDVLKGLTFVLEDEGDRVRVKVTQDLDAMAEQIKKFTESYNDVVRAIGGMTKFEGKHDAHKLAGDSVLTNLLHSLQAAVTKPVNNGSRTMNAISMMGVTTAKDGTLKIDSDKLQTVLVRNSLEVERLVGPDRTHNSVGVGQRVSDEIKKYASATNGQIHGKNKSIDAQIESLGRRRAQMTVHSEKYEEGLRKQFTDLERNMSKLKSQNSFLESQANNRSNNK